MLVKTAIGAVIALSAWAGNPGDAIKSQSAYSDQFLTQYQATLAPLPSPEEYLRVLSGEDFELLNRIINAESGWKITAHNPTSSASGLAQFLDSTFESLCINKYQLTDSLKNKDDPYIQIKCMVLIIKDGGLSHWFASKHLWQN